MGYYGSLHYKLLHGILASYPGSSTEKRGGSLEDFITCLVTYVRGFVRGFDNRIIAHAV